MSTPWFWGGILPALMRLDNAKILIVLYALYLLLTTVLALYHQAPLIPCKEFCLVFCVVGCKVWYFPEGFKR